MGSLRRWLKARLGLADGASATEVPSINLLDDVPVRLEAPSQIGIAVSSDAKPWSVSRLKTIFRDAQRNPGPGSDQAARHARHCLSSFWLTAPVDQLEPLYTGAIGDLQRLELEGPLPQQPLADDEQQWRDGLVARMLQAEQASQKLNLLLAVMPYFPPRSLDVEDPLATLPRWMLRDYVAYCQPELRHQLDGPAGLLSAASAEEAHRPTRPQPVSPEALEPLTDRRGEAALDWLQDAAVITRLKALINLYGLDPADADTLQDLSVLRRVLAQLWLDVDGSQLAMLFQTPVGLLTRSLHTAGFGQELLDARDQQVRRVLASQVEDLSEPESVKKLLALLPFCPPGSITITASEGIPGWLLDELSGL